MKALAILAFSVSLIAGELHDAVKSLDNAKIAELLEGGVDINATDVEGQTPLHIAARIGRLSIVRQLLAHAPDLYAQNNTGDTPLGVAIAKNNVGTVKLLLAAQRQTHYTPSRGYLHTVVETGDVAAVEALLKQGYSVESADNTGVTLLHRAAKRADVPMVALLLQYGADANAVDKEGRDALYYARYGQNEKIIEQIIDARR